MASPESLTGLVGVVLLLLWCALAITPREWRWFVAGLVLGLSWLPVSGLPVAGYVRAVTSELSLTAIALLSWAIVAKLATIPLGSSADWRFVFRLVAAGGLFLYPMALGLGPFDPYTLGFAPTGLLAVLAICAALAWWRDYRVCLSAIVLAALAYRLDLLESENLWDYVLDPWLVLCAIYDLWPSRRNS